MPINIGKRTVRALLFVALASLSLLLLTTVMAYAARSSQPQWGGSPAAAPLTSTHPFTTFLPWLSRNFPPLPDDGCPAASGWQGQYWDNATFTGDPVICRDDPDVAFAWGQGSPDPGIPAEHFSARWKRILPLPAGRYVFHLAGDDGMRLKVDDNWVIDGWQMQVTTEYTVALDLAAGPHWLEVAYYENDGNAEVSLWWEGPGGACSGLRAQYFANMDLSGTPAFTRCDGWVIDHDWSANGPGGSLGTANYSVRWTGQTHLISGTYTFVAVMDDGMRVRVDGQTLIDAWKPQPPTEYRAAKALSEGNHDVTIEYYQEAGLAVARFHFERRDLPPGIVISQQQGFDKCDFATVGQLQAWWNGSPYREVNIYIGGSQRATACTQANLTRQNLSAASSQGWNFIPTWVGRQAWCSPAPYDSPYCISYDPAMARSQGRSEAGAAATTAASLGLTELGGSASGGAGGSTEIYFDLEAYTNSPTMRIAVNAFLTGWVGRLHELGLRGGVYGITGNYMPDWASNTPPPDDVWVAAWKTPYYYDPNATVWGLTGLPDTLWGDHQRLHQYTGGHNETWGGVTFNIDGDVIDGHVAGINTRPVSPSGLVPVSAPPEPAPAPGDLRSVQLLPSGQGYALRGDSLLWTTDAGSTWSDATPAVPGAGPIRSAHYFDPAHGWLLLDAPGQEGLIVARTADGGQSWATSPLAGPAAALAAAGGTDGAFSFVNADTGWLALRLPSSSNFSRGALFATRDGGQSWSELSIPIGGPVRFVDAALGWAAGGPAGDELYVTRDGGLTWQRQDVAAPPAGGSLFYALPDFSNALDGALAITVAAPQGSRVDVYRTHDGGQTWQPETSLPLVAAVAPGGPVPSGLAVSRWAVADPARGLLWSEGVSGAARELAATGQLQGAVDLQFANGALGWALVQSGSCTGDKNGEAEPFRCASRQALLRTADGGVTWSEVKP